MKRRERVILEEVVLPAVVYAELQARYTFDPLVRGLHPETKGTPSGLTIRLQEAVSGLHSILQERQSATPRKEGE